MKGNQDHWLCEDTTCWVESLPAEIEDTIDFRVRSLVY